MPRYFVFVREFLDSLSERTLREVTFRSYPPRKTGAMQVYDLRHVLGCRLSRMKRIDDSSPSASALMCQAKLVVVDYLSTAYLEALMLDVPTIFFWNRYTRYVEYDHRNFFDTLLTAGICQTDPTEAARFVEEIGEDPDRWWKSQIVREARQRFLNDNMSGPKVMIDHLLRHSLEKPSHRILASCP